MSTIEAPLNSLPKIGITIGDPAGIGPEIVLKSLSDKNLTTRCRPLVIGDRRLLLETADRIGVRLDERVEIVDLQNVAEAVKPGEESAATGRASGEYILKAVELWRSGEVDAI